MKTKLPKLPKIFTIRITTDKDVNIVMFGDSDRPKMETMARKAMARGATVRWEDGREEWIDVREKIDPTKQGSAMYTWDKTGDKVLANVIVKTRSKGKVTERSIGTKYVAL